MRSILQLSAISLSFLMVSGTTCPNSTSGGATQQGGTGGTGGSTQPLPPAPVAAISISSSAGLSSSTVCAIIKQQLYCWNVVPKEINVVASTEGVVPGAFIAVAVSDVAGFACGVRKDEKAVCWKAEANINGFFPQKDFFGEAFNSLSLARNPNVKTIRTVCGIRKKDNVAQCWRIASLVDVPDTSFATIMTGADFACALDTNGKATCFQDATIVDMEKIKATQVALNNDRAFVLLPDGKIAGWQLALWDVGPPKKQFKSVSVGTETGHACGVLTDGKIDCWSAPGTYPSYSYTEFSDDLKNQSYLSLSTAKGKACAVTTTNDAVCWQAPDAGYKEKGIPAAIAGT